MKFGILALKILYLLTFFITTTCRKWVSKRHPWFNQPGKFCLFSPRHYQGNMTYSDPNFKPVEVPEMEKPHFEILLENMELNIKMMHEGFAGLSEKIDANHRELKGDISFLDEKISVLSQRVTSVETNLNAKIDSVEANLSKRMDGIDGRLDDIHSELIDHRNNSEMHRAPRRSGLKKAA